MRCDEAVNDVDVLLSLQEQVGWGQQRIIIDRKYKSVLGCDDTVKDVDILFSLQVHMGRGYHVGKNMVKVVIWM